MKLEELIRIIKAAGVVGAGGAGFPTHVKLSAKIDTIILNCAECEPLLKVDRQLLAVYPREILSVMTTLCEAMNCRGIIAVKGVYKEAVEAVKAEIGYHKNLRVHELPNIYPAGDEIVMIYEATGRVVPEGAIPSSVGVAVLNVETILNIYNAVNHKEAVTQKYITIAGEVVNPVTVKVPLGMKVADVISLAGGSKLESYEIVMGGPMTGKLCRPNSLVTKTTKGLLVLPDNHSLILKKKASTSISLKRAMSVCSQCQMCTDLCPRNLLGHSIKPHRIMNTLASGSTTNISDYISTMLCCECGLCEMYTCHQGLSPRLLIKEVKESLRKNGVKNTSASSIVKVHSFREDRMVPMDRLVSRLGLSAYRKEAKLQEMLVSADRVTILLQQHIGAPAKPLVSPGDLVQKGQLIAEPPSDKLGATIHSSIDGKVEDIKDDCIIIAAISKGQVGEIYG